jgi:hypothetical protein
MIRLRSAAPLAAVLGLAAAAALVAVPAGSAAPARPNLVATAVSNPPASAKPGATVAVRTTVRNTGRARSPRTAVRVALSRDRAVGGDLAVATTAVAGLRPRRAVTVTTRFRVPARASGSYYVVSCADPARRVRETGERDNCRVSSRRMSVTRVLDATLSGTLTFVDEGTSSSGISTKTWDRESVVQVRLTAGPSWEDRFGNQGSSFTFTGEQVDHTPDPECPSTWTRTETGGGLFQVTGDPFRDEIYGWFGRTDLSEITLGVLMRYQQTTTHEFCGTTTWTGGAAVVNSLELTRTASTDSTITYRVTHYEEEMGTTSQWDSVSGTLVLRRR